MWLAATITGALQRDCPSATRATYLGGQLPVPLLASHHLMTKAMTVFVLKETERGREGVSGPQGSRFHHRPSVEFCPNRVEFPRTVGKIADSALQAFSGVSSCEVLALAQSDMS